MQSSPTVSLELSPAELQLVQQLRRQPGLGSSLRSLLGWADGLQGPPRDAHQIEEGVIQATRQLAREILAQWAREREASLSEQLRAQDSTLRLRHRQRFQWWTTFGLVAIEERVWRSATHHYLRPLPADLGIHCRGQSRRLQRVLADFGADHAFAQAVASVREHYGFEMGVSAVRRTTLKHAQRAQAQLEKQYCQPFGVLPAQGPDWVVAEADGSMICTVDPGPREGSRPRQWKEVRLVAAQALGRREAVYGATFGSVAEAGQRWGHVAREAGRGLSSQIHALGDGAAWIERQCREVFGAKATFLCDFYHVAEYLAAAAPACARGRPKRWRHTQQRRLRRGARKKVLQALEPYLEPSSRAEEEAPVRQAHRYLSRRAEQLDYPGALAAGLPIGSGLIESGHRHVLQARLKQAGTAWLPNHAQQMAHLRVLRANHQWSSLWS